jgi:hypothetical protein
MSLFRRILLTLWPKRREDAPAVSVVTPDPPVTTSDASIDWTLPNRQLHFALDARRLAFTMTGEPLTFAQPGKRLAYTVPTRRLEFTLEVVT